MDIEAKVNRAIYARKAQATLMYASPSVQNANIDTDGIRLQLDAVRDDLMFIVEADRLYASQKKHNRKEYSEYLRRQRRLKAIRLKIGTLTPETVQ